MLGYNSKLHKEDKIYIRSDFLSCFQVCLSFIPWHVDMSSINIKPSSQLHLKLPKVLVHKCSQSPFSSSHSSMSVNKKKL